MAPSPGWHLYRCGELLSRSPWLITGGPYLERPLQSSEMASSAGISLTLGSLLSSLLSYKSAWFGDEGKLMTRSTALGCMYMMSMENGAFTVIETPSGIYISRGPGGLWGGLPASWELWVPISVQTFMTKPCYWMEVPEGNHSPLCMRMSPGRRRCLLGNEQGTVLDVRLGRELSITAVVLGRFGGWGVVCRPANFCLWLRRAVVAMSALSQEMMMPAVVRATLDRMSFFVRSVQGLKDPVIMLPPPPSSRGVSIPSPGSPMMVFSFWPRIGDVPF